MANKDCFAYRSRRCGVLTERICNRRKCPFYKTRKQYNEDLDKYPPIDYELYLKTGRRKYLKRRGYRK
jgi:hypothetical protein